MKNQPAKKPKQKTDPKSNHVQFSSQTVSISSAYPPPAILAHYNDILPGAADRILYEMEFE